MATHSSVLAWRIPWTEEPGGLQSMGCKESDTTERLTVSLFFFFKLDVKGSRDVSDFLFLCPITEIKNKDHLCLV